MEGFPGEGMLELHLGDCIQAQKGGKGFIDMETAQVKSLNGKYT